MQIQLIEIEKLKPYEKNPRHNDSAVEKVAQSIKEFGFRQPIVVDKNFEVIAGHTRLKAALQLGLKEVPVHVAENLSKAQIKAYRLADNRVAQEASWNIGLLTDELENLQISDFDLSLTGFDSSEIDNLLNPTHVDEEFEEQTEGFKRRPYNKAWRYLVAW
jgi:site-specific DNA-methyltransferase (adenine-specific)